MTRNPDLLLTLILLGSVLAFGLAANTPTRPRTPLRKRSSDADLRRRFPAVYARMRNGAHW